MTGVLIQRDKAVREPRPLEWKVMAEVLEFHGLEVPDDPAELVAAFLCICRGFGLEAMMLEHGWLMFLLGFLGGGVVATVVISHFYRRHLGRLMVDIYAIRASLFQSQNRGR